ncbi:MAG TPA: hypothetical protein ACFE0H_15865 [Elainellaceae cyanobacterium]
MSKSSPSRAIEAAKPLNRRSRLYPLDPASPLVEIPFSNLGILDSEVFGFILYV